MISSRTSQASRANHIRAVLAYAAIDKVVDRSHRRADNSRSTYDQVVDLMNTAKRLRDRSVNHGREFCCGHSTWCNVLRVIRRKGKCSGRGCEWRWHIAAIRQSRVGERTG